MQKVVLTLFLALLVIFLFSGDVLAQTQFARNLTVGSRGEDVRALQRLLNEDARTQLAAFGPGSPGEETTYFGPLTHGAVIRFQEVHGAVILAPLALSSGTGFVGPSTRGVLNVFPSSQVPGVLFEGSAAEEDSSAPFSTFGLDDDSPNPNSGDGDGDDDGDGDGDETPFGSAYRPPSVTDQPDFDDLFSGNTPDDFDSGSVDGIDVKDLPNLIAGILSVPFGGTLINTDYASCSCGAVVLTIQEKRTQGPMRIIYFYALDLLKRFGIIPDEIPTPTLYAFYNIFTPGVEHLGEFIPTPNAPCLVIIPSPPYCSVTSVGASGYLLTLGTSLIPAR